MIIQIDHKKKKNNFKYNVSLYKKNSQFDEDFSVLTIRAVF